MMLLHWSPRSPFVHKVMVALEETGLRSRVELTRSVVPATDPEHPIFKVNPLGQIPTLVLDDGKPLSDSLAITAYLDQVCGKGQLFPTGGNALIEVLQRHALGSGLIDNLVKWVTERHWPPEQQDPIRFQYYGLKLDKVLAMLESKPEMRHPERFDVGDIAVATALAYLNFRAFKPGWEAGHPLTAEWYVQVAKRPSMIAARLQKG
jgi:glutathione S-transferase